MYPHAGGSLHILGALIYPPLTSPPLTPTLMSTDINQSFHAICHQGFYGILDFIVKKVIWAFFSIFAILRVVEDPL